MGTDVPYNNPPTMAAGFQAVVLAASTPNWSLLCVCQVGNHGGMLCGGGGGKMEGIGPVDEVFYTMPFRQSINNGGHRRCTTTVGPHSRLLSIQQSANILCDRLVSLKLEKTIIIYVY
jgi:hypothetical protein